VTTNEQKRGVTFDETEIRDNRLSVKSILSPTAPNVMRREQSKQMSKHEADSHGVPKENN